MAKVIKRKNYKTTAFGAEGYIDLREFAEVTSDSSNKGELRLIYNAGSWRVGLSTDLYTVLGSPHNVLVRMSESRVAFTVAPEGTPNAFEICKGNVIYSASLAEKIKELAVSVEFLPNVTTRCGRIEQVQTDADNTVTVILGFA